MKRIVLLAVLIVFLLASCAPTVVIPTRAPIKNTVTIPTAVSLSTALPVESSTPVNPTATVFPTVEFTTSAPATCSVAPVVPKESSLEEAGIPGVTEADWKYGTQTPKVTILAYCNYQRAACKTLVLNLAELQKKYKDTIRVVLRHYPQSETDDKSLLAAQAAEAAGLQNRFWEMNTRLYNEQSTWSALSQDEFKTWLSEKAVALGISKTRFETDMNSRETLDRINQMVDDAAPLKIKDTPVMFYNGILVKSKVNLESLDVLVKYFLLPEKAYDTCPEMTIDPAKKYIATFTTEKGQIVFELYPGSAPWAVNSFVFLANAGWFNNTDFFRVVPGFVVQGGDPSGSGRGGPGDFF
jgi:protein-disulfide isomerase